MLKVQDVCLWCRKLDATIDCSVAESTNWNSSFMKSKLIEAVSAGWSDVEKLGICSYLS